MRAVYSFWSQPKKFERFDAERWALSTHLARHQFGEISLVTDTIGAERFDRLGIVFDHVDVLLDFIDPDEMSPEFWAAGKLYAYASQTEPFIHLDDDVFLFGNLPDRILTAGLFMQSPEIDGRELEYYTDCVSAYDWSDLDGFISPLSEWTAYNAGIIGGHDLDFFQRYTEKALAWGREMTLSGKASRKGMTLMEQASFAKMARDEGKKVECLLDHRSDPAAYRYKYTHLVDAKWNPTIQKRVSERLRKVAPALYTKLAQEYDAAV